MIIIPKRFKANFEDIIFTEDCNVFVVFLFRLLFFYGSSVPYLNTYHPKHTLPVLKLDIWQLICEIQASKHSILFSPAHCSIIFANNSRRMNILNSRCYNFILHVEFCLTLHVLGVWVICTFQYRPRTCSIQQSQQILSILPFSTLFWDHYFSNKHVFWNLWKSAMTVIPRKNLSQQNYTCNNSFIFYLGGLSFF
jgi:hypothetical protein